MRPLGKWFGEENFTYILVFGSLTHPHVFPLFVPDKLLAKEISYQTVGQGLTKIIRDATKTVQPCFPIPCGTYILENFKNSLLEIEQLKVLCFPLVPNQYFDPNGVAKDVTSRLKLKPFSNKPDKFDYLFEIVPEYSIVERLAPDRLTPDELINFKQYHHKRITHLP